MRFLLALVAASIFAIGLVMIFSTTSAEVLDHDLDKSTHQALVRQIYYSLAGLAVGGAAFTVGYRKLLQISPVLLLLFTFLLLLTLIPGIGREVNGSKRWLNILGLSFQPSEFVKYILPAYFIHLVLAYDNIPFKEFIKLGTKIIIPIFLILIEPNNGTAAIICLTIVVLCLLMRITFKFWGLPIFFLAIVGGALAYNLPYVSARLKVYLNPELDLKGKGHQPYQAKIAAGSGKLFGKGPGNSLQKLSYLPEAQNDYIAAIYAEEFGFLGILALVFLYMLLCFIGLHFSFYAADKAGTFYAAAITFLISFQAFLNMGVVSGLLPSTGLNLPLFSQGGSSLMANITGIAILLNISLESTSRQETARGEA